MKNVPKGEYLQFGGQAIIEGVMMRSPKFFSVACRAPNGKIIVKTEAIEKTWIGRQKWLMKPFLRGTFALLDSMALGIKAMRFASKIQTEEQYAKPVAEGEEVIVEKKPSESLQNAAILGAMVFGIAFGFFIFNFMPNALAEIARSFGINNGTVINYIAEIIKMIFFIGYLWLISLLPDIRELFRYHGAEHKAINVMEAEQDLNVEHCLAQTRIHPRCGTSFAVIVMLLGFLFLPLVPRYPITGEAGKWYFDVPVRVLLELCILPLIAGVAYELLRLAGKMRNEKWVNIAFKPGMWTQLITTKEPDTKHVQVAMASLKAVIEAEHDASTVSDDEVEHPEDMFLA
jgi:uncharacterized protein YqhQ